MNLKVKTDLAGLKTTVNNLVVDKLKDCSRWFCKPSNVVNKDVVKKTVHDKLISKVIAADTEIPSHGALVTKTQHHSDKQDLEKKITGVDKKLPNTSEQVKTDCNTKITEIETKIPSINRLVTTVALNTNAKAIENKISYNLIDYQKEVLMQEERR